MNTFISAEREFRYSFDDEKKNFAEKFENFKFSALIAILMISPNL